jgi:hypothetical protein
MNELVTFCANGGKVMGKDVLRCRRVGTVRGGCVDGGGGVNTSGRNTKLKERKENPRRDEET